jgi:hypothetical protein
MEDICGKEIFDSKGQARAEIPRAEVQPVQDLRKAQRVSSQVRDVPDLLQEPGPRGKAAGSRQGELVIALRSARKLED